MDFEPPPGYDKAFDFHPHQREPFLLYHFCKANVGEHHMPCGLYMPDKLWFTRAGRLCPYYCGVNWSAVHSNPVVMGRKDVAQWMTKEYGSHKSHWPEWGCSANFFETFIGMEVKLMEVRVRRNRNEPQQKEVVICQSMPEEIYNELIQVLPTFLEALAEVTADEIVHFIPPTFSTQPVPHSRGVWRANLHCMSIAQLALRHVDWIRLIKMVCCKKPFHLMDIMKLCDKLEKNYHNPGYLRHAFALAEVDGVQLTLNVWREHAEDRVFTRVVRSP